MSCYNAINKDCLAVIASESVENVLVLMKKKKADMAAVVDENGVLKGMFSISNLFKNALPVSVAMADGVQLDIPVQAAPGVAKRLRKVEPLPVSDLMEQKITIIHPDIPLWEGINALVQHNVSLPVIERDTGKFLGLLTYQSALEELQRLKDSQ